MPKLEKKYLFEVTKAYEKTWKVVAGDREEALRCTKGKRPIKTEHIGSDIRQIGLTKEDS